jgi:hypothetical protein
MMVRYEADHYGQSYIHRVAINLGLVLQDVQRQRDHRPLDLNTA